MAGKSYNNDIFKIITLLDKKSYNFFRTLTEVQYKELQPYTLLRWLSSTQNGSEEYVLRTNEIVNNRLFNLAEHKELLLNMLCSCGSGGWNKHVWIPMPKDTKQDKDEMLAKSFYNLNDDEWKIKKDSININEIKEYLGIDIKRKK